MNLVFSQQLDHGRFETWTIKPDSPLMQSHQVHGVEIVEAESLPCQADGLISDWNNLNQPMAIKTADCLPIVIEGETGVVFLHAGWKGLALGILKNEKIQQIKPKQAFIGPSIQVCCFQVSEEFKENFPGSPYFQSRGNKYYFNLQQEAKRELENLFSDLAIKICSNCTCCNHKFHSYRRDKTTLRNWNLYIKG